MAIGPTTSGGLNAITNATMNNLQDQDASIEKYARINGRDVSPPVRLTKDE